MKYKFLWVAILPILAMIILSWLFLIPSTPVHPSLNSPLALVIMEPLPNDIFDSMLSNNELPNFQTLMETGYFGETSASGAHSFRQACMEIITGKISHRIPDAGVALNPETYEQPTDPADIWNVEPNILDIARWHNHRAVRCHDLSDCPSPLSDLLVFYHEKSDTTSYKSYLFDSDQLIGDFISQHPEITVLIISPGSFQPCSTAWSPNKWLQVNGLLEVTPEGRIDWSRTRAFVADAQETGIRIHSSSVYAKGTVDESDFGVERKRIAQMLKSLQSEDTGESLISTVYPAEQRYRQHRAYQRPDLGYTLNPALTPVYTDIDPFTGTIPPEFNLVTSEVPPGTPCYTSEGGWILLSGPPFAPKNDSKQLLTTDLTPTVLFLLDIPIGADMHGRVIKPAMTDSWLKKSITTIKSHDRSNPRVEQPLDLMTE